MKRYKIVLKNFLAVFIYSWRGKRKLTQEQMAEFLHITPRAYGDLERGRFCFSANALIFFLLLLEEKELIDFIDKLRDQIFAIEHQDIA